MTAPALPEGEPGLLAWADAALAAVADAPPGSAAAAREVLVGTTVVVKYGGHAMSDPGLSATFATDVAALHRMGVRLVVVHGGGPQIDDALARLGVAARYAGGLRVTTPATLAVVRMVLGGEVRPSVVALLAAHGLRAVGVGGEDAGLITAVRRQAVVAGEAVDAGLIGDVAGVDPTLLDVLLGAGMVPVVSPVSADAAGEVLNVNADTAAGAVAAAVGAARLVMLTDVPGVFADWPAATRLLARVSLAELDGLLGDLQAGMVPKMAACRAAVAGGVAAAVVADGRRPHALLAALLAPTSPGTVVHAGAGEGGA